MHSPIKPDLIKSANDISGKRWHKWKSFPSRYVCQVGIANEWKDYLQLSDHDKQLFDKEYPNYSKKSEKEQEQEWKLCKEWSVDEILDAKVVNHKIHVKCSWKEKDWDNGGRDFEPEWVPYSSLSPAAKQEYNKKFTRRGTLKKRKTNTNNSERTKKKTKQAPQKEKDYDSDSAASLPSRSEEYMSDVEEGSTNSDGSVNLNRSLPSLIKKVEEECIQAISDKIVKSNDHLNLQDMMNAAEEGLTKQKKVKDLMIQLLSIIS